MTSGNDSKLRKGAWGSDEDTLLTKCMHKYGEGKWSLVPRRAGHTPTVNMDLLYIVLLNL